MNHSENIKSVNLRKMAVQDSHRWPSANSYIFQSHWRLVIAIALCVFFGEAFVMIAIRPLYHFSTWLVALLDAFILIILLSPILYFLVFRPLVLNINERERTEQALRESEQLFQTVFQTIPDAVTISRLDDGLIVDVNEGFSRLSQYPAAEVKGRTTLDINIWHDPKDREEIIARLQEDGRVENFEAEFKRKDGRVITGLLSTRVIMLNNEPHITAVSRDITDWKKAQKKLQASHQFLQIANQHNKMNPLLEEFIAQIKELTNCAAAGMRILDENGNIPYQAYEGFSPEFYQTENPHTIDSIRCMCSDVIMSKTNPHIRF